MTEHRRIGDIDFLYSDGMLYPRLQDGRFTRFHAADVDESRWHGYYLRARRESDGREVVLLPGDPRCYYYLCDLPDGAIRVATPTGERLTISPCQ